jgi:hypothetical protein
MEKINNIRINKIKSVFEFSFEKEYENGDKKEISNFHTKNQILNIANDKDTYPEIREFLKKYIREGHLG